MDMFFGVSLSSFTPCLLREKERETDYERSSFIIAITANALKGEAQKCFSMGMNDFVTKPTVQVTGRN